MAVHRYKFLAPSHHMFQFVDEVCDGGDMIELDETDAAMFVERGQLQAAGGKPTGKKPTVEQDPPEQPPAAPPEYPPPAATGDDTEPTTEAKAATWPATGR